MFISNIYMTLFISRASACIILHNICQRDGDQGDWLEGGADAVAQDPPEVAEPPAQTAAERRAGLQRRNAIIEQFR